jgi:hypothetical protein
MVLLRLRYGKEENETNGFKVGKRAGIPGLKIVTMEANTVSETQQTWNETDRPSKRYGSSGLHYLTIGRQTIKNPMYQGK